MRTVKYIPTFAINLVDEDEYNIYNQRRFLNIAGDDDHGNYYQDERAAYKYFENTLNLKTI